MLGFFRLPGVHRAYQDAEPLSRLGRLKYRRLTLLNAPVSEQWPCNRDSQSRRPSALNAGQSGLRKPL